MHITRSSASAERDGRASAVGSAITMAFGLQILRVLLPSLVWYLGDAAGVSYFLLGPLAFGIFLASFLSVIFRRALGQQRALMVTVGGLGLVRLAEQAVIVSSLDLVLAILGTILFSFFFPIYLAQVRAQGGNAGEGFGLGILLGLLLDTTIHGALGTLDLSWQQGPMGLVIVLILVAAQWWCLLRTPAVTGQSTDASFPGSLPLAALGPFIFLAAVVLQNVAYSTTMLSLPQPAALFLVLLSGVLGILAYRVIRRSWLIVVAAVLLAILVWPREASPVTGLATLLANLLAFPLLLVIFAGLGAKADRTGLRHITVANSLGWLLFVLLAFLYYISYDLRTGIPNQILPPVAAVLVGLAALGAARFLPREREADYRFPLACAGALLVIPLALLVVWQELAPVTGNGFPVRVMTYNLHNGFNTDGRLDPESIARTIEQAKPDILGLQEVERGWYIDSSLDLLGWLSQRLRLPYIYGPTADPIWGNAVLSRYPIKEWGNVPLPPRDLLLKRGLLWARVDIGSGQELLFIVTHFHHVEKDAEIRRQQSPELIRFWNKRPRTIVVGDFNATPDSQEIAMLREAGLQDAFMAAGQGQGLTWPSYDPRVRIDYIWLSPDLAASDLVIPQSTASDHLGIAVTVNVRR